MGGEVDGLAVFWLQPDIGGFARLARDERCDVLAERMDHQIMYS
jgi:hypothetical protein